MALIKVGCNLVTNFYEKAPFFGTLYSKPAHTAQVIEIEAKLNGMFQ